MDTRYCPQCHYPYRTFLCENPACLEDKPEMHKVLIVIARAQAQQRADYERAHRGIDYRRSIGREGY
jgi:hypothetical protein